MLLLLIVVCICSCLPITGAPAVDHQYKNEYLNSGNVRKSLQDFTGRKPEDSLVEETFNPTAASTGYVHTTITTGFISRQGDSSAALLNDAALDPPIIDPDLDSEKPENCFCTHFHRDRNLQTIKNGRVELYGIRLKKGEKALLKCSNSSMNLVWPNGACSAHSVNLSCNVCQKYKSNDIPSCQFSRTVPDIRCTMFPDDDVDWIVEYEDKDFRVGSSATFSCRKKDQILNGTKVAVCLRSSEWSSPPPKCTVPQIRCPPIHEKGAFVVVYSDDRNINSIASSYCKNVKHLTLGLHTRKCLPTGEWTDANPACTDPDIRCTRFSDVDADLLVVDYDDIHMRVGSRARFLCLKNNQRLNGTSVAVCLRSGEWSSSVPQCMEPEIRCPPIEESDVFDVVYSNDRNLNSIARFYCKDVNHTIEGPHTRTCLPTGEWSDANPTCKDPEIRCTRFSGEAMDPLLVAYIDNDIRVGSRASFLCRENNQRLNGAGVAVCLRNGKWSSPPPQCTEPQISCPPMDESGAFVVVYSNDRNINSTASFFCKDSNLVIEGLRTSTCLSTGEWSDANPACKDPEVHCTRFSDEDLDLLVVDHDDNDIRVGSRARFACRKNNQKLSGASVTVCLRSGKWSSPPPQCMEPQIRCPAIYKAGGFAIFYSNDRNLNSTASFFCKDNNQIIEGLPTRTCLSTGQWSGANPLCKDPEIRCPRFSDEDMDMLVVDYDDNDVRVGSAARFLCRENKQRLKGTSLAVCLRSGEWSSPPPQCMEPQIRCPPMDESGAFAVVYSNDTNINSTASFFCKDSNLVMDGLRTSTCLSTGEWSDANPACKEPRCKVPSAPEHGSVHTLNGEKVDSIALYSCDKDTTLVGHVESKCLVNEEWTFPPPKCLRSCVLPSVSDGVVGHYEIARLRGTTRYQRFVEFPVGKKFKHGETVILQCKQGFTLVENSTFDGHRSMDEVACGNGKWLKPLKCKSGRCSVPPPPIRHGNPVVMSQEHNAKLQFRCDQGFEMKGFSTVRCQYGEWTGEVPECVEITSCSPPRSVENGKVTYSSLEFGSELTIECDDGHSLRQTKPVYCKTDGTWNVADVKCVAVFCSSPKNPINGRVSYTSLQLGTELMFHCDDGYRLQQTKPMRCLSDGTWSKSDAICIAVYCAVPENPENGEVFFTTVRFGSQLTFECNDGYQLHLTSPVYCTSDGTWSKAEVTCAADFCDPPEDPENGKSTYLSLKLGSQLNFECNNGYRLLDTGPVYCTPDRVWSKTDVACVAKTCDRPEDPENGQVIFTSLKFESVLEFKCDDGYKLKGKEPVHCTSDGTWSNTNVECIAISCDSPEDPKNGRVIYSSLEIGSQLKFKCDHGYALNKKEPVYCTLEGAWSITEVQCIAMACDIPKHPKNGQVTYTSLQLGSQLKVKCDEGYHKQGEDPVCTSDRTWSKPDVRCVVISCDHPEHPDNGQVSFGSLAFGSRLRYICDDGYQLQDAQPVTCRSDGTWSRTDVRCVAKSCGIPEQPENGQVTYSSLAFGSKLTYKCNRGYTLQDTEPVICKSDGAWSRTDVRCALSCDHPEHPENGQVSFGSLQFGSRLRYMCDDGYQLQDTQPVTCRSDGTWSRTDVRCVAKSCGIPEQPENGQVTYSSLKFGSKLKFKCNRGYTLQDTEPVICKSDGTWSRTDVRCAKPCILQSLYMNLPEIEIEADEELVSMPYNSNVRLTCNNNENMMGNNFARCGSSGNWEYSQYLCMRGCLLPEKRPGSELKVVPEKDFFKLGDTVTLSCPAGQSLNIDLERMMCLKDGWSSSTLPECVETEL